MKKFDIKKVILAIAIGFLLSVVVVSAAEILYSKNFTYSTSNSTLKSTNVQGAIDELAEKMGISTENVMEAIRLSAENIEDIDIRA